MMKLAEMSDREILVHLVHRVYGIEKRLDNHLKHVWALVMALVVALLGVAGSALAVVICK